MIVRHWRKPPPHSPILPNLVAVWEFPESRFETTGVRYISSDGRVSMKAGGEPVTIGMSFLLAESDNGECFVISIGTLAQYYPEWTTDR